MREARKVLVIHQGAGGLAFSASLSIREAI